MSSVSSLYRRYLLVCSEWSLDATKSGRDFALHIRNTIPKIFPNGELTEFNLEQIREYDKQTQSLERLNKGVYFKKGFVESSASGLTASECKQVISTESLQYFEKLKDSGIFERIKIRFGTIRFIIASKRTEPKADK